MLLLLVLIKRESAAWVFMCVIPAHYPEKITIYTHCTVLARLLLLDPHAQQDSLTYSY
jgi:hypothetical protein